jgi:Ppx/GppA phosphatase family
MEDGEAEVTRDAAESPGAQPVMPSPNADAARARQAAKAERKLAKRATKAARKEAAKAARAERKRAEKAAAAEAKAARRAAKTARRAAKAAKADAKAAKADAKAARAEAERARLAEEAAARVVGIAATGAVEASRRSESPRPPTARTPRAPRPPRPVMAPADRVPEDADAGPGPSPLVTGHDAVEVERAAGAPTAAGSMLQEVAGLVRQTTEPAAARIVRRVSAPPAEMGPEAMPRVEPEREPESAPELAPEPAPELAPEPAPESASAPAPESASAPAPESASEPEPVVAEPQRGPDQEPQRAAEPETASQPGSAPSAEAIAEREAAAVAVATVTPLGATTVIGAAVDIGANSAHLLVAAAGGHRIEPLLDGSVFLGLGDRVSADGYIGATAREEIAQTLATYAETARRLGAREITIVGTEPVRRAADAAALARAVEARAGVPLFVLDHDEEAMLTLLGVTMGQPVRSRLLVVDIGGGSCELIVAGPGRPIQTTGIRLGSARLTLDLVKADPPTMPEVEAMRAAAKAALADAPDVAPDDLVAVGGTASNLLKLMPATSLDRELTQRRVTVALAMLTVQRSDEAAERHLIRPQRARILPAGAVIVEAILERYGMDRLRVAEEGIREGTVLVAAAFGSAWRDRLPTLAAGWGEDAG